MLQGDSADCMYFVEDGEVRITATKSVSMEVVAVHLIEAGTKCFILSNF